MRNCEEYREMISLAIDGELDDRQFAELQAHLSVCDECALVYDAFLSISDSIADDWVEPPEPLARGIMYKLSLPDYAAGKRKRFAWGRYTAIAACLALILFGCSRLGLFGGAGSGRSAADEASISERSYAPSAEESSGAAFAVMEEPAAAAASDNSDRASSAASMDTPAEPDLATSSEGTVEMPAPAAEAQEPEAEPAAEMAGSLDEEFAATTEEEAREQPDTTEDSAGNADNGEMATLLADASLLSDMTMAEIWSSDPNVANEPDATITDSGSLDLLGQLLSLVEEVDSVPPDDPLFTIRMTGADGEDQSIVLWLESTRLLIHFTGSGTTYTTRASLSDLLTFLYNA